MKLQLPTGRVVELVPALAPRSQRAPRSRKAVAEPMLYSAARELFREGVRVRDDRGNVVPVDDFALTDFHALRAIAAHEGWLEEEAVPIDCINCKAPMTVKPCAHLPLGPFLERALEDEELDVRLPEDTPHEIPPIALPRGGEVEIVSLRSVTVAEAAPLHVALAREALAIDAGVVRAMGITMLGDERDAKAIAEALEGATDDALDAVFALFLDLHYPLRLFGIVKCESCGARNDVDAPFDREFEVERRTNAEGAEDFVGFTEFAKKARAVAEEIIPEEQEATVALLVEGGVPVCDEGGIALLGSYVPASPGDALHPSRGHEIAVYYRTFRATWDEEGPFDWEAELRETIEHEYEHFLAELRGGDPMDEAERREIADEAIRIHGKSTLLRAEVSHLGSDFLMFLRRTWILWVILIAASFFFLLGGGQE